MRLYRVGDVDFHTAASEGYDIAFFACGYEERCTHVPSMLDRASVANPVVLAFTELTTDAQRLLNERFFDQRWTTNRIAQSANDDANVFICLRALVPDGRKRVRIAVDYSSMSRLWYAAVLAWARYLESVSEVTIDLFYAVGDHRAKDLPPMVIKDILAIPGCEGITVRLSQSVALFGLGFDSLATLCVLDRLEPDVCYCYFASPAAFGDYPQRVRTANQEIIKAHSKATLELPLFSVEQTYRYLVELVTPHRGTANISIVPMGPKPHVLAALLLSMRFRDVGCLRVGGQRTRAEDVGTTGRIVCTRMEFRESTRPDE